ncbi:Uncharacterized protein Fot_53369 [Forsythia ovata]|uniref:Uncharacterized protein n=1 Tax=Forsythia ovata TaxID=205694 RepID=A0ABD1PIG7_9LAMI
MVDDKLQSSVTSYISKFSEEWWLLASKGIGELVRPEVTWGEIIRQRKFDSRVGQIFTEILCGFVLRVGLLALSLRSLPLMHIPRFTIRLVKEPLTQVEGLRIRDFPLIERMVVAFIV